MVEIVKLPPDQWRDYRDLRLRALSTDPIAFTTTLEEARSRPEAFWRQRLADPRTTLLFARVGDELVGTIGAIVGSSDDPDVAEVVGAFVEPAHRGRGIGKTLLQELLAEIATRPNITTVRLTVTETQAPAIAVYASFGFVPTGASDGIIRVGNHGYRKLVMERSIHRP